MTVEEPVVRRGAGTARRSSGAAGASAPSSVAHRGATSPASREPADDPAAGYHFTIVPHTHWDREWYLPFEVMRMRLARTVEEICDVLDADPRFTSFTLDGQAVILEDVVELRPDLEPRLRRLLAAGRLVTGPSYVLPDEFLAGPEALVRNFLVGRAVCRRFGTEPMAVGYLPDTFGHVGQLPQLLRGFGLDAFIFWRGMGDEAGGIGLAFAWRAPDGSEVTGIRQLGSYGNASQLGRWEMGGVDLAGRPDRYEATAARRLSRYVTAFRHELDRTFATGTTAEPDAETPRAVFLCNGSDHESIHRVLPDLVEASREAHARTPIEIGSYEDYWRRLQPVLGDLPVHAGELAGGRDAPVLRGINSARMPLKQAAEVTERALLAAETLASLAVLAERAGYPHAELDRAWREHLRNLPHDSISGCSVDEVATDMLPRFLAAQRIAGRVQREALAALAGTSEPWTYEPTRTRTRSVVNVLGHSRAVAAAIPLPDDLLDEPAIAARLADGTLVPAQLVRGNGAADALVLVDLPGFGAADVTLAPAVASTGDMAARAPARADGPDAITNGILSVIGHTDGSVTVRDERTGLVYAGLHRFEDVADRGDEYTFCPVEGDMPRSTAGADGTVRVTASGPVLAELELRTSLDLPERLSPDRRRRVGRRRVGRVPSDVVVRVALLAGSDRVRFTTTIDNRSEDHRLRVRFAAPGADDTSLVRAEGHFEIVRRTVRQPWAGAAWTEPPAWTQHTAGAVSAGRLALYGHGLPEYEAVPTNDGLDLALTLLRCVGWLSRDDLATRPGGAGPTIATPGAQCLGRHTFRYEVAIGAQPEDLDLLRTSADVRTEAIVGPAGVETAGLLAVDGPVAVTALKGAEDGEGVVLRVVAAETGSWTLATPAHPERVRLGETPEEGPAAGPIRRAEIRSVRLRPGGTLV